jgi:hypothetical protein
LLIPGALPDPDVHDSAQKSCAGTELDLSMSGRGGHLQRAASSTMSSQLKPNADA